MDIQLRDFQALSRGTYNAGELTLNKSGKLAITNNHVRLTSLNKQVIDNQTIRNIKEQFVKALSNNGVNIDEIQRVRKELGLPPTQAGKSSITLAPLSRQQVRQILDRYAGTINESIDNNKGEVKDKIPMPKGKTVTLNGKTVFIPTLPSDKELERETIRNKVNEKTITTRNKANRAQARNILEKGLSFNSLSKMPPSALLNPKLLSVIAVDLLRTNKGFATPNQIMEEAVKRAFVLTCQNKGSASVTFMAAVENVLNEINENPGMTTNNILDKISENKDTLMTAFNEGRKSGKNANIILTTEEMTYALKMDGLSKDEQINSLESFATRSIKQEKAATELAKNPAIVGPSESKEAMATDEEWQCYNPETLNVKPQEKASSINNVEVKQTDSEKAKPNDGLADAHRRTLKNIIESPHPMPLDEGPKMIKDRRIGNAVFAYLMVMDKNEDDKSGTYITNAKDIALIKAALDDNRLPKHVMAAQQILDTMPDDVYLDECEKKIALDDFEKSWLDRNVGDDKDTKPCTTQEKIAGLPPRVQKLILTIEEISKNLPFYNFSSVDEVIKIVKAADEKISASFDKEIKPSRLDTLSREHRAELTNGLVKGSSGHVIGPDICRNEKFSNAIGYYFLVMDKTSKSGEEIYANNAKQIALAKAALDDNRDWDAVLKAKQELDALPDNASLDTCNNKISLSSYEINQARIKPTILTDSKIAKLSLQDQKFILIIEEIANKTNDRMLTADNIIDIVEAADKKFSAQFAQKEKELKELLEKEAINNAKANEEVNDVEIDDNASVSGDDNDVEVDDNDVEVDDNDVEVDDNADVSEEDNNVEIDNNQNNVEEKVEINQEEVIDNAKGNEEVKQSDNVVVEDNQNKVEETVIENNQNKVEEVVVEDNQNKVENVKTESSQIKIEEKIEVKQSEVNEVASNSSSRAKKLPTNQLEYLNNFINSADKPIRNRLLDLHYPGQNGAIAQAAAFFHILLSNGETPLKDIFADNEKETSLAFIALEEFRTPIQISAANDMMDMKKANGEEIAFPRLTSLEKAALRKNKNQFTQEERLSSLDEDTRYLINAISTVASKIEAMEASGKQISSVDDIIDLVEEFYEIIPEGEEEELRTYTAEELEVLENIAKDPSRTPEQLSPAHREYLEQILEIGGITVEAIGDKLLPTIPGSEETIIPLAIALYTMVNNTSDQKPADIFAANGKRMILAKAIIMEKRSPEMIQNLLADLDKLPAGASAKYCYKNLGENADVSEEYKKAKHTHTFEDVLAVLPKADQDFIRAINTLANTCDELTSLEEIVNCVNNAN